MKTIATVAKFKALAKMGYIARGVVYLVIGGLAILAAAGEGGRATDSKGAITEIMHQPFGKFLLGLLIIGLVGYVIWRLIQAITDTDKHGTSIKGLLVRGGLIASAASHAVLALWTLNLLIGGTQDESDQKRFLATDLGQIVIAVMGVAFVGAGFAHIFKGWTARFERYMDIPAQHNIWARPVCRFGLIARGVVWCIAGWFCVTSAVFAKNGKINGIVEAFELLRSTAYGTWIFGIVAAGLFAFGIYSVLEAIYRKIEVDSGSALDTAINRARNYVR